MRQDVELERDDLLEVRAIMTVEVDPDANEVVGDTPWPLIWLIAVVRLTSVGWRSLPRYRGTGNQ